MLRGRSRGEKLFDWFNLGLLAILGFLFVYPFIYSLALSFNDGADAMKGGIYFIPRAFTLDNYRRAFYSTDVINAMFISISRTVLTTTGAVLLSSMGAFALSFKELPGRRSLNFFIFFSNIFGGGVIPTYVLYRTLGIVDTFWVFVFPGLYSFYNILIMRVFFQNSIPEGLRESALIDGAGLLRVYAQIYMPLAMPILATVGLFVAVAQWNAWFDGLYYVRNQKLLPLSSLLQKYVKELDYNMLNEERMTSEMEFRVKQTVTPESFKMAVLVITTAPIICVYPFLQKYFVKGVMIGSIKE
ncbi:MAG: carbohydrate ABC transporter permease [Oscillospiraceae bacterium]|nr:carbohydrate ABC transporter permease [Oscillospiraceae bacterium]